MADPRRMSSQEAVGMAEDDAKRTVVNGKHIDFENLPAPEEGFLATLFITVRKVARSREFYSQVLGGTVVLEENPCIVKLANTWIRDHRRRLRAGRHDVHLPEPARGRH